MGKILGLDLIKRGREGRGGGGGGKGRRYELQADGEPAAQRYDKIDKIQLGRL